MKKKKTITLSMEEWLEIVSWCETYYHENLFDEGTIEYEKDEEETKFRYKTFEKLLKKYKG